MHGRGWVGQSVDGGGAPHPGSRVLRVGVCVWVRMACGQGAGNGSLAAEGRGLLAGGGMMVMEVAED